MVVGTDWDRLADELLGPVVAPPPPTGPNRTQPDPTGHNNWNKLADEVLGSAQPTSIAPPPQERPAPAEPPQPPPEPPPAEPDPWAPPPQEPGEAIAGVLEEAYRRGTVKPPAPPSPFEPVIEKPVPEKPAKRGYYADITKDPDFRPDETTSEYWERKLGKNASPESIAFRVQQAYEKSPALLARDQAIIEKRPGWILHQNAVDAAARGVTIDQFLKGNNLPPEAAKAFEQTFQAAAIVQRAMYPTAGDQLAAKGSAQTRLRNETPPHLRNDALEVFQRAIQKDDEADPKPWGLRLLGQMYGSAMLKGQEAATFLQAVPGAIAGKPVNEADQEANEYEHTLREIEGGAGRWIRPDQHFVSKVLQNIVAMVPEMAVARTPVGMAAAFSAPTAGKVYAEGVKGGASARQALSLGASAGTLEYLLFSKIPGKVFGRLGGEAAAKNTIKSAWDATARWAKATAESGAKMTAAGASTQLLQELAIRTGGTKNQEVSEILADVVRSIPETVLMAGLLHLPGGVAEARRGYKAGGLGVVTEAQKDAVLDTIAKGGGELSRSGAKTVETLTGIKLPPGKKARTEAFADPKVQEATIAAMERLDAEAQDPEFAKWAREQELSQTQETKDATKVRSDEGLAEEAGQVGERVEADRRGDLREAGEEQGGAEQTGKGPETEVATQAQAFPVPSIEAFDTEVHKRYSELGGDWLGPNQLKHPDKYAQAHREIEQKYGVIRDYRGLTQAARPTPPAPEAEAAPAEPAAQPEAKPTEPAAPAPAPAAEAPQAPAATAEATAAAKPPAPHEAGDKIVGYRATSKESWLATDDSTTGNVWWFSVGPGAAEWSAKYYGDAIAPEQEKTRTLTEADLTIKKPYDGTKPEQEAELREALKSDPKFQQEAEGYKPIDEYVEQVVAGLRTGRAELGKASLNVLRKLGYDSIYVLEGDRPTYGVLSPDRGTVRPKSTTNLATGVTTPWPGTGEPAAAEPAAAPPPAPPPEVKPAEPAAEAPPDAKVTGKRPAVAPGSQTAEVQAWLAEQEAKGGVLYKIAHSRKYGQEGEDLAHEAAIVLLEMAADGRQIDFDTLRGFVGVTARNKLRDWLRAQNGTVALGKTEQELSERPSGGTARLADIAREKVAAIREAAAKNPELGAAVARVEASEGKRGAPPAKAKAIIQEASAADTPFGQKMSALEQRRTEASAARQDFMDALNDFAQIWSEGKQLGAVYDPRTVAERQARLVSQAAVVVGTAIRAGVRTFAEFLQSIRDRYGADVAARMAPALRDEWERQRGLVRPDLAIPATDPDARTTISDVDKIRTMSNRPEHRHDEAVTAEADMRWEANPDSEKQSLASKGANGQQLDDVETVLAKRIMDQVGSEAVASGDSARIEEAMRIVEAYRETGATQGRAMRQRRDPIESPEARMRRSILESILEPPQRERERRNQARRDGDRATADRINAEWAKKMAALKAKLKSMGIDIDNLNANGYSPLKGAEILRAVSAAKADKWDKMYEYWLNSILSAPTTQASNIIGNVGHAVWSMTAERAVEALVNTAARDTSSAQWGEFKYLLAGVLPGISRGARNFLKSWATESPVLEAELGREGRTKVEDRTVAIGGRTGRIVRMPVRLLGAVDDFCKSAFVEMEVGAQAYRIAKSEGLDGRALQMRIHELTIDTSSAAWDVAYDKTLELAFQQKGATIAQKIKRNVLAGRRDIPMLRYLIPFVTTPMNIFETGIRKSPLGSVPLAKRMYANYRAGRPVLHGLPKYVAEQVIAWSLVAALLGNDDDDPWITGGQQVWGKKREVAYRTFPPNSIQIGRSWYSYARLEPFATIIGLTVDWTSAIKSGDSTRMAKVPIESFINQMGTKTFLSGIGSLVEAADSNSAAEGIVKWGSNFTTSWVPNVARSLSREADNEYMQRRVWGRRSDWLKRLGKRTLQRTELVPIQEYPIYDVWGRPASRTESPVGADWLWRVMVPIRVQKDQTFVADRVLMNWNNQNPDDKAVFPTIPQPYYTISGKRYDMTDEEYAEFCKLSGELAVQGLSNWIPKSVSNPTLGDIKRIERVVENSRTIAKARIANKRISSPTPPP